MNCQDNLNRHLPPQLVTRRWFFEQCRVGLGTIALGQLLKSAGFAATENPAASNPLVPKKPHHAAKAKNIIYLFMAGGPSHMELFDYKPQLEKF